jgi:hypothetical protein
MAAKSPDTLAFEKLSKQRLDYSDLPGGGQRARLTLTLPPSPGYPNGQTMVYVEEISAADVAKYATTIAGTEIGYAIGAGHVGYDGVEVGAIARQIVGAFDFGKLTRGGLGKAGADVAKVAKKVVTSKVMQSAAKGLMTIAPTLGPLAPVAMGVGGGIGVAGQLLGAKTAQDLGAPLTAMALASGAVTNAGELTKSLGAGALPSLLRIANDKANAAGALSGAIPGLAKPRAGAPLAPSNVFSAVRASVLAPRSAPRSAAAAAAPAPAGDVVAMARAGRVRSNLGGTVTPSQLQAAHRMGRVFFVAA